jgi:hypothetical protein
MEDEASPSTPLHPPGTGQAQSASTPEQPRRHHPRDDDTSNHPNEDNTQDSHGPHKRRRPEQDEEPSDVPAPKLKRGRGGKGARGGRGAKAKANGPNARPAIDQEVRRSGRTSAIGCESSPNLFLLLLSLTTSTSLLGCMSCGSYDKGFLCSYPRLEYPGPG